MLADTCHVQPGSHYGPPPGSLPPPPPGPPPPGGQSPHTSYSHSSISITTPFSSTSSPTVAHPVFHIGLTAATLPPHMMPRPPPGPPPVGAFLGGGTSTSTHFHLPHLRPVSPQHHPSTRLLLSLLLLLLPLQVEAFPLLLQAPLPPAPCSLPACLPLPPVPLPATRPAWASLLLPPSPAPPPLARCSPPLPPTPPPPTTRTALPPRPPRRLPVGASKPWPTPWTRRTRPTASTDRWATCSSRETATNRPTLTSTLPLPLPT